MEKVSETIYEDYVEEKILKPLKINNSSVRLKNNDTATAYTYDDGNYVANPLPYQYTSGSAEITARARSQIRRYVFLINK